MARSADNIRTKPSEYVLIMLIFLILIASGALIIQSSGTVDLQEIFMKNPFLNGVILGVLGLGILYNLGQVFGVSRAVSWVNDLQIRDSSRPGTFSKRPPGLLAPMAALLRDSAPMELSAVAMRSILETIGNRLDESRENSRYMIGVLIFLGLLGTFWGLIQTIDAVSSTIGGLSTTDGDVFQTLTDGLREPLAGMGLAFSTSLFGLASSLVLGFLDLQAGQSQNRFYNDLEEFLSSRTSISRVAPDGALPVYGADNPQLTQLMRSINRLQQTIAQNQNGAPPPSAPPRRGPKGKPGAAPAASFDSETSAVFTEMRDHIQHMDRTMTELAARQAASGPETLDELSKDVRALRELITSIALDEGSKR